MPLARQPLFTALTRPQMVGGLTYAYFVLNLIVATEVFLLAKSFAALLLFAVGHAIGYAACLEEPRRFDLWFARLSRGRPTPNARRWRGNSYRP